MFDDPVPNPPPDRSDSGLIGLRVLRERVERSREAFSTWDASHGGHYWYQRQYNYYFGGYCETTITVDSSAVTSRKQVQGDGIYTASAWTETVAELGSHPNPCDPAWTMNELYDECLNKVLCEDPRETFVFVHVDGRGLLVECGYIPINCADDCYAGIGPLILTSDGKDWTETSSQCCPPSPEPGCCMSYGGAMSGGTCGDACDGMPLPSPHWSVSFDATDCPVWVEPPRRPAPITDCCGCSGVSDAGTSTPNAGP